MGRAEDDEKVALRPIQRAHLAVDWLYRKVAWAPAAISVVTVFASGTMIAVGALRDDDDGAMWGLTIWGIIVGAVGALFTVLVEVWRNATRNAEIAETGQHVVTVRDALKPLAEDIAVLPSRPSAERQRLLGKILGNAASSVNAMIPMKKRLRINVFQMDVREDGLRELSVAYSAGRSDRAKKFVEGDGGRGDAVFAFLKHGDARFVADRKKSDDPIEQVEREYRTYISAPIIADGFAYGMLTVDSPYPGDLDQADVPAIDLLGHMLGIAFALAVKR